MRTLGAVKTEVPAKREVHGVPSPRYALAFDTFTVQESGS